MSSSKIIVLITGSNQGIGFETAVALASFPEYHIIISARSQEKCQKGVSELQERKLPGSISSVVLDVTDEATIKAAVASVEKEFGRLDALINNAGVISMDPSMKTQFEATFATNSTGPAMVAFAFLPLLEKSEVKRMIFVTSGLGSIGTRLDDSSWMSAGPAAVPAHSYRMSKAALNMLASSIYMENKHKGFKVWSVCPGYVVSNLTGPAGRKARIKNNAGSASVSGEFIAGVVQGKKDAFVGQFINTENGKEGTFPW